MFDVFISYARESEGEAHRIAEALRALGYGVWRDDEIPAHRLFGDVIEERLAAARVVLVLWSAEAAKSPWVRSEASRARTMGKLVQATLDKAPLPIPFDQIQCANLVAWRGEADASGWRKVVSSIDDLADGIAATASPVVDGPLPLPIKPSIAVLPFTNLSGDPEQEYFSDGISEDIITDLSKVSALAVVSRNSAFRYKGQHVDLPKVARQLGVGHVLEGSVRKAGGRVRITAQLIDGATNDHVWAERYDRDLTDIFALQDEVSEAIVRALKLNLLPQEKKAIERRASSNPEAYDLFLMARWHVLSHSSAASWNAAIRLLKAATDIDPDYADAWMLMGWAQRHLMEFYGQSDIDALACADRALAIDPHLAEAHAVRGMCLWGAGRQEEARSEIATALRLAPASHDVIESAAMLAYFAAELPQSAELWRRTLASDPSDFKAALFLSSCLDGLGDAEAAWQSAAEGLRGAEDAVKRDPTNGFAISAIATALARLGQSQQAKSWAERALTVDPENTVMRYNLACMFSRSLGDADGAVDFLAPLLPRFSSEILATMGSDPDFAPIRANPRFMALLAGVEALLAKRAAAPRTLTYPDRAGDH